jgi:molybdate transport system permease protein
VTGHQASAGPPVASRATRGAVLTAGLLLVAFLAVPVVNLLVRALSDGDVLAAATDPSVTTALGLSLLSTTLSLALTVVLGTPLAWALARGRVPAEGLVQTLTDLPIVLPPAVAGLALLLLFGRQGPVGAVLDSIGIRVGFTVAAVVLAQSFVSAPFFVRAARAGFESVQPSLEEVASDLGASPWQVVRHVSLPIAAPFLASGAVTAWARALGEFGATIMFAGNVAGRTQTLPLAVYGAFQSSLSESIAAAAILVVAAGVILLGLRIRLVRLTVP